MEPTFTIPPETTCDLMRLPCKERNRIHTLLATLEAIHRQPNDQRRDYVRKIAFHACHQRGFSESTLLRAYRRYTAKGEWRVLVNACYSPLLSVRCTGDLSA